MLDDSLIFSQLLETSQDYAIYILDSDGNVATWNTGAVAIKQYTSDEIIGRHYSIFFSEEDQQHGVPSNILAYAALHGRHESEGWRARKDGSLFWANAIVTAMKDASGKVHHYAKITRDLTARKHLEASLQTEKDRLFVTLQSIADGVICTDPVGKVTLMNPAAQDLCGWDDTEAKGRPIETVFRVIDPEGREISPNPIRLCIEHERPFLLQENATLIPKNGEPIEVQDSAAPIRGSDGSILGTVLVFQNVTKLRRAQREIAFHATHDSLTQLPNRRHFQAALDDAVEQTKFPSTEHTVCFLDLDRFKIVNDTAGHAAGDVLLRIVGQRLSECLRNSDLIARLGGDEFAVLFRKCTVAQAMPTLQKMLQAVEAINFVWEGTPFGISASIGVTALTSEIEAEDVTKQADVACYAAKRAGRNCIRVYIPNDGEGHEQHQQLRIAADLRKAISENRFFLMAQPIVSTRRNLPAYYEILLRMKSEGGEVVSPAHFIPAAERYGLMVDIDRWVMTQVLLHCAEALAAVPDLRVSLNLSANSLNTATFYPFLIDLVRTSALTPERVLFEITETALIANLTNASSLITQLRELGCKVALDDFGIGVSSFSYLRSFPVDCIKIDGSFIRNIAKNPVDLAVVQAITMVAGRIAATTVAEWVEDESTFQIVRELGIDYVQGYGVGRPVPLPSILSANSPNLR